MTFPTDILQVSNESTNTNTHSVLLPGDDTGDILSTDSLGFWFSMDSNNSVTTPSGYTQKVVLSGDGHSYRFFQKDTVVGNEGSTSVSVTSGGSAQKSAHWSIASDGQAFHFSTGNSQLATDAPDCDIVSPGVGTKDFNFYATVGTDTGNTITTVPSGYSDGVVSSATGAGNVSAIRSLKAANASSEDPGVYAMGSERDSHSFTMAVEPTDANPTASGAASIPAITASGAATVQKNASGAAVVPAITGSGTAKANKIASGAALTPVITASGATKAHKSAVGAAVIAAIAAAGAAENSLIAVRDEVTSDSGASQTTAQSFTLPDTVNNGDVLLCFTGFDGATGTVTGPGGIWTSTRFVADTGADIVAHTAVATAGLGGTTVNFTIATARFGSHHCWAIRNGGTVTLGSAVSGSTNNPDPPNTTPAGGAITRMWFPVAAFAGNSGTLDVIPTGYANSGLANRSVSSGTDGNLIFCRKVSANASENPSQYTAGSNFSTIDWTALTASVEEVDSVNSSSGAASIPASTASGAASVIKSASGAATTPAITASGVASVIKSASGAASIPAIEASGVAAAPTKTASGAPSIPAVEASGAASVPKTSSGAATIPVITASGVARVIKSASGAATIPASTASGAAKVHKVSSGAASIAPIEASGTAGNQKTASGAASIPAITASGAASVIKSASGAPSIPSIEASGVAGEIDPPTVPFVPNEWNSTLSALGPHHWWMLDETSGDALDTGATAGLDMIESSGTDNRWRLAPGPIRGQPREYALWGSQSLGGGLKRVINGLFSTGFSTGGFGAVVHVWSTNDKISYIIQQIYDSNTNDLLELTVELDGAFQMRVGTIGTDSLTARTAAGLAIDGTSFVVMGVQRGDGTGIRLYVDGVDVTDSNVTDGAGTLDSFPDDVLTGASASTLSISTNNGAGTAFAGALISNPFIFVNSVPNDSQILALSNSAIIDETNLSDYFETVFFQAQQNNIFWVPGWNMNANKDMAVIQLDAVESEIFASSSFTNDSTLNNLESGGVGRQIISQFNNYFSKFAANPGNSNIQSTKIAATSVGTFNFVGHISGIDSSGFNIIFNYGEGRDVGTSFDNVYFYLAGSAFGYKWAFRLQRQSPSDFFQALAGSFVIPDADAITMFTVVQDGTGVLFYVDGLPVNTDDTSSGSTFDNTSWLADVDALTSITGVTLGGAAQGFQSTSNFEPNEMRDVQMLDRALTAAEIATRWDAVNGIFPAVSIKTSSGAAVIPATVASGTAVVVRKASGAASIPAITGSAGVGTEGIGLPGARFESIITIDARFESTVGVLRLVKANFSSSVTIKGNFS